MREILFRGKSADSSEWVEGSLVITTIEPADGDPIKHYHIEDMTIGVFPNEHQSGLAETVAPETVGQYTGLTDKNSKKIFEGDIVRVCLDPEICVGNVIWDSEIASYNIPFNNGKCVLPLDIFIAKNKVGDKVWIEVIGNIHDNPDLLDEK